MQNLFHADVKKIISDKIKNGISSQKRKDLLKLFRAKPTTQLVKKKMKTPIMVNPFEDVDFFIIEWIFLQSYYRENFFLFSL